MMPAHFLEQKLQRLGFSIEQNQLEYLQKFIFLLAKWNKIHNLSGANSIEQIVDFLILDSLLVTNHLDYLMALSMCKHFSVLDIGSGNGSPGIVWAIVTNNIYLTLVEKSKKKAAFLNNSIQILGLGSRVKVLNGRMENISPSQKFSLITCRAFMDIQRFLEQTFRFASDETCWLLMTTKKISRGLYNQLLEKRGIIKFLDNDEQMSRINEIYERNFENKKILLLKKLKETDT